MVRGRRQLFDVGCLILSRWKLLRRRCVVNRNEQTSDDDEDEQHPQRDTEEAEARF